MELQFAKEHSRGLGAMRPIPRARDAMRLKAKLQGVPFVDLSTGHPFSFLHKWYEETLCEGRVAGLVPTDFVGRERIYNGYPCSGCGATFAVRIGWQEERS